VLHRNQLVNSANVRTNQTQSLEIGPDLRTNEQLSAPQADWASQHMQTCIAPFLTKNDLFSCNASGSGNLSELSAHRFWAESSDKRLSAQDLRPNIRPIYHQRPDRDAEDVLLLAWDA
jgi:hypothetical protein